MELTLGLFALVAVVAARIYFGHLAAQTFDALPAHERRRIASAIAAGTY